MKKLTSPPIYLRTLSRSDKRRASRARDRELREERRAPTVQLYGEVKKTLDQLARTRRPVNLTGILPAVFQLNEKPFSLSDYPMFEPLYATSICRRIVLVTGRQVAKSSNQAVQGILMSLLLRGLKTLFITPLFEQIRKFSTNYVHDMMVSSPVSGLLVDRRSKNVLQRSLPNGSTLFFSFAMRDAGRVRGTPTDKIVYDECQGIDPAVIPIIGATMTGSRVGPLEQFTGTPLTYDNTAHRLISSTSWAEWVIPCRACRHQNIPTLEFDLERMLGPIVPSRPISRSEPGLCCARCGRPVSPRDGVWIHRYNHLRNEAIGLHIGQPILPLHCEDDERWLLLQAKRAGGYGYDRASFTNEILGEACDSADKLLTETDLRKAGTLGHNDIDAASQNLERYTARILGVDWGGGGVLNQREIKSYTALAVVGMLPDGKLEIIYGWRCPSPHDHNLEVAEIVRVISKFKIMAVAHDYTGAGAIRETLLRNAGLPGERIFPISYVPFGSGPLLKFVPYNEISGQRAHYRLDKARGLTLMAELIRLGEIRFFQYDYLNPNQPGLMHDWLSLIENKVDRQYANDAYAITHDPVKGPDDFAQACTIGAFGCFQMTGHTPSPAVRYRVPSTEELNLIMGPDDIEKLIDESGLADASALDLPKYDGK